MKGAMKWVLVLHVLLLVYSGSAIFSKFAAEASFPSFDFCFRYLGALFLLGIYALGWQQVLKRLSLTFAFSNKAIVVLWGVLWGFLLFGEAITPQKIIGCLLIVAGVVLFSHASYKNVSNSGGM